MCCNLLVLGGATAGGGGGGSATTTTTTSVLLLLPAGWFTAKAKGVPGRLGTYLPTYLADEDGLWTARHGGERGLLLLLLLRSSDAPPETHKAIE